MSMNKLKIVLVLIVELLFLQPYTLFFISGVDINGIISFFDPHTLPYYYKNKNNILFTKNNESYFNFSSNFILFKYEDVSLLKFISNRMSDDSNISFSFGFKLDSHSSSESSFWNIISIVSKINNTAKYEQQFSVNLFETSYNSTDETTLFGLDFNFMVKGVSCKKILVSPVRIKKYAPHKASLFINQRSNDSNIQMSVDCIESSSFHIPFKIDPISYINSFITIGRLHLYSNDAIFQDLYRGLLINPQISFDLLARYTSSCDQQYNKFLKLYNSDFHEDSKIDNNLLDEILEYEMKLPYDYKGMCMDYRSFYDDQIWFDENGRKCICKASLISCQPVERLDYQIC